jgi:acid stress chaperone HdeA
MKRFPIAVVTVVAATGFVLGGCASITNKGGDTTCKEFTGQDEDKQKSEVAKMLKDQNGKEASQLEISGMRVAVEAFCKTLGKDSSKISDASP